MTLVPLALPPGMFKSGTTYAAKARWFEGDRVRWHNGALRPIGGWEQRVTVSTDVVMAPLFADPLFEAVRTIKTWRLNDGQGVAAFGSNLSLYFMDSGNNVTTITPAGFLTSAKDSSAVGGYGDGLYGMGTYGTPRLGPGVDPVPVEHWDFATWGEDLVACTSHASPLYSYKAGDVAALVVPNAPTSINGVVVTTERAVMTIGDVNEPRIVHWSDRENRELWAPAVDNLAGSYVLKGSGRLLTIDNVLNQALILTETDAHVARWVGAPYVYGFDLVGRGCAPIGAGAVAATDRFAIWLGRQNVWLYDGTLRALPCEVMDFLTEDIDPEAASKTSSMVNSAFSEVWWFYQSSNSATGEVDKYVLYDHLEQHWAVGTLDRTAGYDKAGLLTPIMVASDGTVFNHELNTVYPPGAFAETGPIELGAGDKAVAVRYLFPDTELFGDADFSFYTRNLPTDAETYHGPFQYENPISTTGVLGRNVRLRVDLLSAKSEVGVTRLDIAPVGTGFR